ncbi:RNA polymerase sigma factor [Streptomyces xanthochromogenes]|uniref:RNA polymerase sigma factor n=1 Tax=Streptomyces xanthochromogenes TaxID=67384 RepID=UPI003821C175
MKPFLPRHPGPTRPAPVRAPGPSAAPGPEATGVPPAAGPGITLDLRDADRDVAIAHLFDQYYAQLLRLAVLLGADQEAEDVVSEAFYQLHCRWAKLKTPDAAIGYLRSIVCNLTRMRIRRIRVARRHSYQELDEQVRSAEQQVLLNDDQRALIEALHSLTARQRQTIVLKYWLDLKETEVADTMKISVGAVKSHTARGMAKLTETMTGSVR